MPIIRLRAKRPILPLAVPFRTSAAAAFVTLAVALASLAMLAGCGADDGAAPRTGVATSPDGVPIAYTVAGQGPAVVFVHCWCGDQGFWADAMADLARDHRVLAIDLAGHGRSGQARDDFTMQAFAADALAAMDGVGITRAVVVGHSMGGSVALAMAMQAADRVHRIVGIDNLHQVERGFTTEQLDAFMAPFYEDFAATVPGFVRAMYPADADSAAVARASAVMAATPPQVGLSAFRNLFGFDLAAAARAYARPLYLLNDTRYPVAVEQWQAHGVEVRLNTMQDVGHFPMFTAPAEFTALLRQTVAEAWGESRDDFSR